MKKPPIEVAAKTIESTPGFDGVHRVLPLDVPAAPCHFRTPEQVVKDFAAVDISIKRRILDEVFFEEHDEVNRTEDAGRENKRPQTFVKTVSRARQVSGRIPEFFFDNEKQKALTLQVVGVSVRNLLRGPLRARRARRHGPPT